MQLTHLLRTVRTAILLTPQLQVLAGVSLIGWLNAKKVSVADTTLEMPKRPEIVPPRQPLKPTPKFEESFYSPLGRYI